ncbi:FAD-dependent oxidoreductase [Rhodobacterales bacterium HKCCE3408]|nr:FAD-dependent oxidoreductase [Rhodobacterales bacterium HKCCE3408]
MARITVFGAGIFGLSVAWALIRRGARVTIVDPAPERAASRGIVGALAPHVPERWNEKKQFQFESLEMAGDMWAEVAEISGRDPGYARTGRLQPIADDAALALAHERAAGAADLWQGRYSWCVVPEAGTGLTSATGWLIHDDLTARVHPRQATEALTAALSRLGAIFAQDSNGGTEIWAIGASEPPLVAGIKGQAALFQLDWRDRPQLFVDALHVVPHGDGTVAVGSTTERDFSSADGTDAALDALVERARQHVPALRDAPVIERWAGLRPRAPSRAPLLGPHPQRPGAFIANGGFKIGFGMAPKVGAVMADLVLDGVDRIPGSFRSAGAA